MIKSIIVTNYRGDSIQLDLADPEKSGFLIQEISGLGPCKATINTTEVSTNDGAIYNSARLDTRNIVLDLVFVGTNIEELRQLSYKYFPIKREVSLEIITDNRDCIATGYVESNEPSIFSSKESTSISIICPDSYFYSATNGEKTTTFYGEDPVFEFPFCNDSLTEKLLIMGEIRQYTDAVITYDGDSEVGVTVTIHAVGEATNIAIYNTGTREQMYIDTSKIETLTGSNIIAGDDIIICTVKGKKSIKLLRNGSYTNILNALDKDSDWFQLAKGENVFAYTAETGVANLQFKVQNDVIYEGI
jgi:hypothetical protein